MQCNIDCLYEAFNILFLCLHRDVLTQIYDKFQGLLCCLVVWKDMSNTLERKLENTLQYNPIHKL